MKRRIPTLEEFINESKERTLNLDESKLYDATKNEIVKRLETMNNIYDVVKKEQKFTLSMI